jgi:hypothetical protein
VLRLYVLAVAVLRGSARSPLARGGEGMPDFGFWWGRSGRPNRRIADGVELELELVG